MHQSTGDLFTTDCNAICVPTNGHVTALNTLVMGAGVARQAVDRWPGLPDILGQMVYKFGNAVHLVTHEDPFKFHVDVPYLGTNEIPYHIVSFPTKPTRVAADNLEKILPRYRAEAETMGKGWLPGWKAKSDLALIKHSAEELVELTDEMKWKKVCLPRVGCGHGELSWQSVYDLINPILDDRFHIIHKR
jgi:hypothetical protein